jgi:DNA-binding transcriptional LysR family regulator
VFHFLSAITRWSKSTIRESFRRGSPALDTSWRASISGTKRAARGVDVVLNVGKSPYTDPFLVSTLLSIRLPLFPHLRVDPTSQFSCELVHQLLGGSLDLAIATEPPESPLRTTVKIDESSFYIAMSERDKLASCRSINLEDMTGRCWILFERRLHPPLYEAIVGALKFGELVRLK